MSENQTIEAPDFDHIKKESGTATRDAVNLLWLVANDEAGQRRRGIRRAVETDERKVLSDAPTTPQHNYDAQDATVILFTSGSAFPLTGVRNGTTGRLIEIVNLGTGTVTVQYDSGLSDAINRFDMASAADVAVTTGKSFLARYLNNRWRQQVLA